MASTDLIRDAVDASVVPGLDVLDQRAPDGQRVPSRDLDNAASDPVLRDAVGLGCAPTEAGTGLGTEVEGVAR